MLGALLYLRLTSFQNWLLSRVRRLRQPKYLLSAIVGCAYFYFFFFRSFDAPPPSGARSPKHALEVAAAAGVMLPADWLPITTALGACALLFFIVCMWIVPTERASLGFSEAEIAFLFPAPITRRGLVHFRLLSSQFRSLAGAAIMMLFSNRWTFLGGNALTHAIGWWFVFSALNLHLNGARFTLTRLADVGVSLWRRRLLVILLLSALVSATVLRLPADAGPALPTRSADLGALAAEILSLAQTAPLAWLLWPFELVLGPFLAADTSSFLWAVGPAAAVIVLHYLWVVNSAVAFEDASVEHAQKRGERIAAWRSGQRRIGSSGTKPRRAPFDLASTGLPEVAFLWKNLLSAWPYFTWRIWLGSAGVILAGGLWLRTQPDLAPALSGLALIVAIFAVYILVVGPQFARQDIRSDLANADILKTYPLAGWQIILGQLLTPIAILTGILWLALLTVALAFRPDAQQVAWFTPGFRVALGLGIAALIPPLAALQLLVPNAAALLFPGWFHTSRARGGGPEIIGQRMIFFFAQLVAMLFALAPAAAFAAALAAIVQLFLGPIFAVLVAASSALVILIAEFVLGIWLLGRRFEKLDLSAELRS